MNKTATAIAAYALIAVVTFGHAAASAEKVAAAKSAACKPRYEACLEGIPGMNGLLAGTLWPLYWSWEAWK